jgi:hypothetical protein
MTGARQGLPRGEGLGATRWGKLEGNQKIVCVLHLNTHRSRIFLGVFVISQAIVFYELPQQTSKLPSVRCL